jgi:hypothetical protein
MLTSVNQTISRQLVNPEKQHAKLEECRAAAAARVPPAWEGPFILRHVMYQDLLSQASCQVLIVTDRVVMPTLGCGTWHRGCVLASTRSYSFRRSTKAERNAPAHVAEHSSLSVIAWTAANADLTQCCFHSSADNEVRRQDCRYRTIKPGPHLRLTNRTPRVWHSDRLHSVECRSFRRDLAQ